MELNTDVSQLGSASVRCTHFTGTVLGTTLTFIVVPLRIPALGDRQAAVRVTAELPGQPVLVEDVAAVRHEKVLMFYSYAAQQVDQQTFEVLLKRAYAKLVAHY